MSLCEQEASQAISEGRDGPLCLESGNYSPQQCDSNRCVLCKLYHGRVLILIEHCCLTCKTKKFLHVH